MKEETLNADEIKKQKVTFCKVTKLKAKEKEIYWFTRADGYMVDNSISYEKQQAFDFYEKYIECNGKSEIEEVLLTEIINP